MLKKNLRLVLTSAGILGGIILSTFRIDDVYRLPFIPNHWAMTVFIVTSVGLIGGISGFALFPFTTWIESRLVKASLADIVFGVIGLIVGLIISALIGIILKDFQLFGPLLTVFSAVILGYLGISIGTRKRDEVASTQGIFGGKRSSYEQGMLSVPNETRGSQPKILDTSVIIDGRVADLVKTGFLDGPLVVGRFVLEELQHIADSPDVLKRNRGRRGLDVLNQIQKDLGIDVIIYEQDVDPSLDVDAKLVKLAKMLDGKVVTNDFNLNKVAELQRVRVLNINELSNAIKPVVLPGEEMVVTVVKDGKEAGQGVAYLNDGTMIVVEGGKRHMGLSIDVIVTSVLQTAAGRMIFAKPKS